MHKNFFLSLILTVSLLLCQNALFAFDIDNNTFAGDMVLPFDGNGNSYRMTTNITITNNLTIGEGVTLDFNGHTLNVNNGGAVNIIGASMENPIVLTNISTFFLNADNVNISCVEFDNGAVGGLYMVELIDCD